MDQDKTTVMGGYGSAQAGGSADATRVVSNPGNAAPDATQASAEPTRVMAIAIHRGIRLIMHRRTRMAMQRRTRMAMRRQALIITCRKIPFRSLSRRRICRARHSPSLVMSRAIRMRASLIVSTQVDSAVW